MHEPKEGTTAVHSGTAAARPPGRLSGTLSHCRSHLDGSDARAMTEQPRRGLVAKAPPVRLEGEVEIDEVYVVAGHTGQPAAVAKRGVRDAAAGWRERRAVARSRRTGRPCSA